MKYNMAQFNEILSPFDPQNPKSNQELQIKLRQIAGSLAKTIIKLKRYVTNSFHGCIFPELPY
jgi:hypothetical protein